MTSTPIRSVLAAVLLVLFLQATPAQAAAPKLKGKLTGIEICPQAWCGAAIFLYIYHGELNGRQQFGWGWIAVTHEDLPAAEGESVAILGGYGAMLVGVHYLPLQVHGGTLTLVDDHDTPVFDDDFAVVVAVDVCNVFGQCREHVFEGLLSHATLIPTIKGTLH